MFAIRQVSAISAAPVAFLLAGTLADHVFEPAMAEAGGVVGTLFGSGPGRGIGVMFVLAGLLVVLTVFVARNHPRIRNLETEVPDLESAAA